MSNLKPLKCSIGQAATGEDNYFDRPIITNKIRRALDNGSHILISAPRRIGKSSILKHFEGQAKEDEIIKYLSVQSASSSNQFFQALFKLLIKDAEIFGSTKSYMKQCSATINSLVSRFRGVSMEGIPMSGHENIQYFRECLDLVRDFKGMKVVVLLDEFPDAVNNIIRADKDLAIQFLLEVRELRQMSSELGLQFIFTGSSGLANVVSQLGKNDLINDLEEIDIPPYSKVEATTFIHRLVLGYQVYGAAFQLDDQVISHILNRVTWRLPYYLQVIVKDLFEHYEDTQQLPDLSTVDQILSEMITANSQHFGFFENWQQRLTRSFDKPSEFLAIEILKQLATGEVDSYDQIKSIQPPEDQTIPVKQILNILVHDGYISEDQQKYGFNSMLLKQWWLENVAA